MSEAVGYTDEQPEVGEPEPETETGDQPDTPAEPEPSPDDEPEAEADLIEPDEPEYDTDTGDEQARIARRDAEKEIEAQARKLEAEAKRHFGRVGEIMGDGAADLVPCELCWPLAPGLRWDRQPDEDVKTALRPLMGLPSLENYRPATNARKCDDCDGLGQVLSGSQVVGKMVIRCEGCQGNGWVGVGPRPPLAAVPTPEGELGVVYTDDEEPAPDRDPWDRPQGDPLYGVMPGFEGNRA